MADLLRNTLIGATVVAVLCGGFGFVVWVLANWPLAVFAPIAFLVLMLFEAIGRWVQDG